MKLSTRICNNDLGDLERFFEIIEGLQDGVEISEKSGLSERRGQAYAALLKDLFTLPTIIETLRLLGVQWVMPVNAAGLPPEVANQLRQQDVNKYVWDQLSSLESQIQGLIAFQTATDSVSAYGQLILKLAGAVLMEIQQRKQNRHA